MSRGGDGQGDHLSIGEVLAALNDEFPDITISKIRFLESQGLIDPERTPSGYRKFSPDDLTRLRWILFQQKEHFLPLKVIKERLDQLAPGEVPSLDAEVPAPSAEPGDAAEAADDGRPVVTRPLVSPAEVPVAPPETPAAAPVRRRTQARPRQPVFEVVLPLDDEADDPGITVATGDVEQLYSRAALASAAGIDRDQLATLEEYGLVTPVRQAGDDVQFDADALEVATIAAGFFSRGVEARHLRMYRTSAEREAMLFGQVLLPYLRQRNPESRARLQSELVELAGLGRRLRTVLLRDAARDALAE